MYLLGLAIAFYLIGRVVGSTFKTPPSALLALIFSIPSGAVLFLVVQTVSVQAWIYGATAIFLFFGLRSYTNARVIQEKQTPTLQSPADITDHALLGTQKSAKSEQTSPAILPPVNRLTPSSDLAKFTSPPTVSFQSDPRRHLQERVQQLPTVEERTVAAPTASPAVAKTNALVFGPEAQNALDIMEYTKRSLLIVGKAGTGKSTLLRHFVDNTKKKVAVLAPTGIAALKVRGQTAHSFFRFPSGLLQPRSLDPDRSALLYQRIDTIIVDEVSMVRADMMDAMDWFLRKARTSQTPFGGVQMIFIGDPYQLPPVVPKDLERYFQTAYNGYFFFDAPGFKSSKIPTVELTHVYRQNDQVFVDTLNRIRVDASSTQDYEILNSRYLPGFSPSWNDGYFVLTTTNKKAEEINGEQLRQLAPPEFTYPASVMGEFDEKDFPTEYNLKLRKGAQVMMLRNDPLQRWVNGTIGWVQALNETSIQVRLESPSTGGTRVVSVARETWEQIAYTYDNQTDVLKEQITGSFSQYPIKLAWAMTIHKSQGQTFDKVVVDFDQGAFADGQAYVALSRCRTLDGLILAKPIRISDVKVNRRVHAFMS